MGRIDATSVSAPIDWNGDGILTGASQDVNFDGVLSGQVTSLVDVSATQVPEPATLGMMGLGLLGAALAKKRKRN